MLSIVKQFRPKQSVDVAILSPLDNATETGLVFTLCGRYTEAFDKAQAATRDAVQAATRDAVQVEARVQTLVAHCVIGWQGAEDEQGQPVACTPEAVLAVFREAEWLYMQVRTAFLDQTRFFERAKTS